MANIAKEESTASKERLRARYRSLLSDISFDSDEIDKEMAFRYEIALRMMMDNVPDEKIRYYTLLSHVQIEYIRINLLPKATKDSECKSRAMNESLRRCMSYIR